MFHNMNICNSNNKSRSKEIEYDSDMELHNNNKDDDGSSYGSRLIGDNSDTVSTTSCNEQKDIERLARRETERVDLTRRIVITLLFSAGITISGLTYHYLVTDERNQYMNDYHHLTDMIHNQAMFNQQKLHESLRSMATTITATSIYTGEQFPYVTVPVFEVHARATCRHSGIEALVFLPIVHTKEEIPRWEQYSVHNQWWIEESRNTYWAMGREVFASIEAQHEKDAYLNLTIPEHLFALDFTLPPPFLTNVSDEGPYLPFWQSSPPGFDNQFHNYDRYSDPIHKDSIDATNLAREGTFTSVVPLPFLATSSHGGEPHVTFHNQFTNNELDAVTAFSNPHSFLTEPIFEKLDGQNNPKTKIVGYLQGIVAWDHYLQNLLPTGVKGVYCILKNTCGGSYTFILDGNRAQYIGEGDFHETEYDNTEHIVPLVDYLHPDSTPNIPGHCEYSYHVYSSSEYEKNSFSRLPLLFTIGIAVLFVVVIVTFKLYDQFVRCRHKIVIDAATRLNQMLASLFPETVRDQLFDGDRNVGASLDEVPKREPKNKLQRFLDSYIYDVAKKVDNEEDGMPGFKGRPIADLFPDTTVMFADVTGFTAWSSTREPPQVFTLLETLYCKFDLIAKRRKVFKVETVGDCYVAVCGLPEPRKYHALVMARFAREVLRSMRFLTKKMEITLGPDTADLSLRIGLHCGPVTAGVLRGDRARFQLFGDTMNTASRMESTGERERIQVSHECADMLIAEGKESWLTRRTDRIVAKGKGELVTYWLQTEKTRRASGLAAGSPCDSIHSDSEMGLGNSMCIEDKTSRLVDWNVECLSRILKDIAARRNVTSTSNTTTRVVEETIMKSVGTVLEEVSEIITLPTFSAEAARQNPESITVCSDVLDQLRDYISHIANMYRNNAFHNFEHASHVALSVNKLLSRIVMAPDELNNESHHDHTYGITSDPLTQFACVYSALIHDADHTGVPNMQLVKENAAIANYYKGKSVAEQNSVDLAWQLLMQEDYDDLRHAIYSTEAEFKRFRQLVVNSVMATDIVDKELKTLRNARWEKAFKEATDEGTNDAVNRKATIVIEHIIQASDVSHTMQHWHVYRKWNENFFMECYQAYLDDRAENDPSIGWYEGEIGFFDFYIIPLAKKLEDCGVFGVSSDEYLNYAKANRKEWEAKGEEVVREMSAKVKQIVAKRRMSQDYYNEYQA